MIKEKKIKSKYNYKKSIKIVIFEYLKTIVLSFMVAVIITFGLAIKARNEMIKNIYANIKEQKLIDRQMAEKFIQSNSDLLNDIKNKKYIVCMHIGELYETVDDYEKAQIAYESAVEKVGVGNYKPYYKLICVLAAQEKFNEINKIMSKIKDFPDKKLIKFKTKAYLAIGDKYYSIGKFIQAAKNHEKAKFYYDKFKKKDKVVEQSIENRIINSYIQVANTLVNMGYNSDAVRYLKKVEKYIPDDLIIKYKIGIILSDSNPEEAVKYLEPLFEKIPQEIDNGVYCSALMKAANIADLEGRHTVAKKYRYKIHSADLFIKRKVIYKNDIDTIIGDYTVRKVLFTYPLKLNYNFANLTGYPIKQLKADFVLSLDNKALETYTTDIATKDEPLIPNGIGQKQVEVKFKRLIFTKKELVNYSIKIYAYKDEKYKTLISETKIPIKQSILDSAY